MVDRMASQSTDFLQKKTQLQDFQSKFKSILTASFSETTYPSLISQTQKTIEALKAYKKEFFASSTKIWQNKEIFFDLIGKTILTSENSLMNELSKFSSLILNSTNENNINMESSKCTSNLSKCANAKLNNLVIHKMRVFLEYLELILVFNVNHEKMNLERLQEYMYFSIKHVEGIFMKQEIMRALFYKIVDVLISKESLDVNLIKKFKKKIVKIIRLTLVHEILINEIKGNGLYVNELLFLRFLNESNGSRVFLEITKEILIVFMDLMPDSYIIDLYLLVKSNEDIKRIPTMVEIRRTLFIFGSEKVKNFILDEIEKETEKELPEHLIFFKFLKPLQFDNLLHYKNNPNNFSIEKLIEENDNPFNLQDPIIEKIMDIFDVKYLKLFEEITSKETNDITPKNINILESLIQIMTIFFTNEKIKEKKYDNLPSFLKQVEKICKNFISSGNINNLVTICLKCIFQILVLCPNYKFQEVFKLFNLSLRDASSYQGQVTLSRFLRMLSFVKIPPTHKTQIDNFFENELPKLFQNLINHSDPYLNYLGYIALEIFCSSNNIENINFLFPTEESLEKFTQFLNFEIKDPNNKKFDQNLAKTLEIHLKNNECNGGSKRSIFEFLDESGYRKKIEDICLDLKAILKNLKPNNIELIKNKMMKVFDGN